MRSKHARALCAAFCLTLAPALLLSGQPASAADKVHADRLLPPNVYAYLAIPSVPHLKSQCNESTLGELLVDEDLADFRQEVKEQIDVWSAEFEKHTGVGLWELLDIPTGEVAVAYFQAGAGQGALIGLIDFGENRDTVDKLLKAADKSLTGNGAEKSADEFEDTPITVYKLPSDDDENGNGGSGTQKEDVGQTLAYFIRDTRLVAASNIAALESVLVRWDGTDDDVFANNERYQYIREQSRDGDTAPVVVWYIDPIQLAQSVIQTIGRSDPSIEMQAQMLFGFMQPLGLSQLRAIGGGYSLATGQFDSINRIFVYVDFPTSGVLNIVRFPATEQAPPKWVAADSSTYFTLNWDVATAYAAVENLFDSFQGPGAFAQLVDELAEQEGGFQVHIKKDVIDQLTGRIHFVSHAPETDEAAQERFLVALELKDSDKIKSVLATLAKRPEIPTESREFRGETIYEIQAPLAISTGADGTPAQTTMGIGVTGGQLMIASDVTLLEQVIRADPDQPSLADSDEYRKVAAYIPDKTSILGYQRQDTQVKTIYELFRSGQAPQIVEGIDFTKLPPFEAIEKYLPTSGTYAVPDEHGALLVSFTLRREK